METERIQTGPTPSPGLDGNGSGPSASSPGAPGRRRRLGLWLGAAVAVIAVGLVAWLLLSRDQGGGDPTADAADATTTAEAARRDLVEVDTVSGTLGYGDSRSVVFLAPGVAATKLGGASEGSSGTEHAAVEEESLASGAVLISFSGDGDTATTGEEPPTSTGEEPGTSTGEEPPTSTGEEPGTSTGEEPPTSTGEEPGGSTDEEPGTSTGEQPGGEAAGGTSGAVPSTGSVGASTASGSEAGQGATASQSTAGSSAIVTWLPEAGSVIEPGEILFRVDGRATVLMAGDTPAWRTLHEGVRGEDVRQLEENLVALGYDPKNEITVDRTFGPATKAAVKRWQKDIGASTSGRVRLGTVVFQPGERRVSSLETALGSAVQEGTTVLTTTSTSQSVTVDLETTRRDLVAVGDEVSVELPAGEEVPGTIISIGTVATSTDSEGQTGSQAQTSTSSDATVEMVVSFESATGVELDQAPVDVRITKEERTDVLAVPVTALLALAGGGYAVEVVNGTGTHLVAVEPGLYADGYVEITGDVQEGDEVVVPA